jgi:cytochrome b subunit of formate dehydrogenase
LALAVVLAGPLTTWSAEIPPNQIANRRCLNCHGQSRLAELPPDERQRMVAASAQPATQPAAVRPELFVAPDALDRSTHAKLACTDCHKDAQVLPHAQALAPADCGTACHNLERSNYLQGAHAEARATGHPDAPDCADCHGGHDVLPRRDRQSRTYPLNIVRICGDCHQQHLSTPSGHNGQKHVASYLDSVHGRAVVRGGLAVAATCSDCHGEHKVMPSANPESRVNRDHVAETCGKCHVGVSELFGTSVHAQEAARGNKKAPVCTDCHTAHAITRTDTPGFLMDIVNECGTCHIDLYDTYRNSYHGQVTQLGWTRAARCSDCHGAHDIRHIEEPGSRLSQANRVSVCRECHPTAGADFASFAPHANMRNREKYPLLHGVWLYFVIMMSCAFGFFGMHSVLWLIRSVIERIRNGPRAHHPMHGHAIQRFNRVDRVNHAFVIVSFFGLTLTGLPLLYADKDWGRLLAGLLGGVNSAGTAHRFFAVMLIGNFVVHGVGVIRRIRRFGFFKLLFGPATMLPRWKDVTDCLAMFRWFFVGGSKPKFDRWTYWEKFDYVAEVGGSLIIGLTGLLLWFPAPFSHIFPGWMFNVATIIHGYEALLAIGFIFTIHFFNAHLRLEKFPVDDVIFTGRLSEEEFRHERGAEYERLEASGELARLRVKPPAPHYRQFAIAVGVVAMTVGLGLVVLIVLAGLGVI